MELKAPNPLALVSGRWTELFLLFGLARLGVCQQTGEFLAELFGVPVQESPVRWDPPSLRLSGGTGRP